MITSDYIPASIPIKDSLLRIGTILYHIPIERIFIDKQRLSFKNEICSSVVNSIVSDFCADSWEPIFVDDDFCIRDGQHRFIAAKEKGLKYIDVVMLAYETLALEEYNSDFYKEQAKRHPREKTLVELINERNSIIEKKMHNKYCKQEFIL